MSDKKTNEGAVAIADLHEMIDALKAKNEALYKDFCDLQKQNELLVAESADVENRYNEERKQRVEARNAAIELEKRANCFASKLRLADDQRAYEQGKRLASIPKLVIAGAVALVLLIVPYTLQQMTVIGPQLAFTIEAVLLMVIAWCYALIWDRSRKN